MANPISLLLVGLIGSFVIGRINRSSKAFFTCLLALALGFVTGAMIGKLTKSFGKTEQSTIVMKDDMSKGDSTPMLYAVAYTTPTVSYSSAVGKEYYYDDNSYNLTPGVKTAHPVMCLSPPLFDLSTRDGPSNFYDTS